MDINEGDYVKVTIEGSVTHQESDDNWIIVSGIEVDTTADGVTIEKTTPKFKPGDILRFKWNNVLLSLGQAGFIDHSDGVFHEYGVGGYLTLDGFSENWESYQKVEV